MICLPRSKSHKSTHTHMQKFLSNHISEWKEFVKIMGDTGTLIFGSCPLSFMLNDGHAPRSVHLITNNYFALNQLIFSICGDIPRGLDCTTTRRKFKHNKINYDIFYVKTVDLISRVTMDASLTLLATWWNPITNVITTAYPSLFRQRKMCLNMPPEQTNQVAKYVARGFTLVHPWPELSAYPSYAQLVLFDLIGYEEIAAASHFKYRNSIGVQSGQVIYAYSRHDFVQYFTKSATYIENYGACIKTPHNQLIPCDSVRYILNDTYQIYTLTLFAQTSDQSIFSLDCFSLDSWYSNNGPDIRVNPRRRFPYTGRASPHCRFL